MRKERKQRRSRPVQAAALVEALLDKYGIKQGIREQRLVTRWAEIVGERVATRAWPDGLRNGVLFVRVSTSAWLQELSFLREALVQGANREVGHPPMVREIRLHLGPRRDADHNDPDDLVAQLAARTKARVRPAPRARPTPSIDRLREIDTETDKVGDVELREAIRTLRRRLGM